MLEMICWRCSFSCCFTDAGGDNCPQPGGKELKDSGRQSYRYSGGGTSCHREGSGGRGGADRNTGNRGAVEPETLQQVVAFMRNYADKCHHGKEEAELFPFLERRGVPMRGCPIDARRPASMFRAVRW